MSELTTLFYEQPLWAQSAIGLALLALTAVIVNFLIKRVLLRLAAPFLDRRTKTADMPNGS